MADGIIITDDVVLEECTKLLAHCSKSIRECFESALSDMSKLVEDWDDTDYYNLLNALKAYKTELNSLDDKTNELIAKAKEKIEMIHARRSISMNI